MDAQTVTTTVDTFLTAFPDHVTATRILVASLDEKTRIEALHFRSVEAFEDSGQESTGSKWREYWTTGAYSFTLETVGQHPTIADARERGKWICTEQSARTVYFADGQTASNASAKDMYGETGTNYGGSSGGAIRNACARQYKTFVRAIIARDSKRGQSVSTRINRETLKAAETDRDNALAQAAKLQDALDAQAAMIAELTAKLAAMESPAEKSPGKKRTG